MLALAVWASLAVWTWVGTRVYVGKKVVPYERRRPVPWGGIEVLFLLGFFVFAPPVTVVAAVQLFDVSLPEPTQEGDARTPDVAHPVARVVLESHNPWDVLLACLLAVLIAPVVEELMFRVVLQGWVEKLENRYRRRLPAGLRVLPGAAPVLFASVVFAAMHYRVAGPRVPVDILAFFFRCQAVAGITTVLVGALVFRLGSGATFSDVGLVVRRLPGDIRLGLLAYLAVTGPIYLVLIAANLVIPKTVSADPIPLVFLAIVLGALYYRTHRIVPSIVLHMAFNATAVVMLVVMAFGK